MEFMSIVREKAAALAQGAVKTSGVVLETVKSSIAIADKEAETTKIFRELGALMYEAYKSGEDANVDIVAEKCAALDSAFNEIDSLRDKVSDLKNTKVCPKCGAKVKNDYAFCHSCGNKMN